jgi:Snf7
VRDKLRRYQGKLENDSKKLEAQVKELIALRLKNRALLVLKLKRFKEKELDKIESKLMTIQTQINDVEWASINVSILNAIEAGTKELNRIHEERSVEDVQLLIDESNEAIEVLQSMLHYRHDLAVFFLCPIKCTDLLFVSLNISQVENRINLVLAGQLTASDELELESELETIMNSFSVPVTKEKKDVVSTKLIGKKLSEEVPIPDIVLPVAPDTPILPTVVKHERKSEVAAKLVIPS